MRAFIFLTALLPALALGQIPGKTQVCGPATGNKCATVTDGRLDSNAVASLTGWSTSTTGLTTSTALAELVAASGTNRIYVKSWKCSSSSASTTATDQQCRLKSGTGTNCGANTTEIDGCFNPALGGCLGGELVLPAGHALCVVHAAAGSKIFTVTYKQAP